MFYTSGLSQKDMIAIMEWEAENPSRRCIALGIGVGLLVVLLGTLIILAIRASR